ncbi:helix-turn-helix domain-containing protein [Streptomyces sp. URMC 124]|uniref:helix-turn-helix domain-containing protein n=1 Tax=Streptomyces sp. URMC 124 TaxID=3423405 RepID=UPI003F1B289F
MGEVFLPGNHRYLGNQFMMWRQEAGMSREEVAEAVGYSSEMVRSVEQGRRACPPRMAEIADELFGARGKLKAGLSYLTREKFPERSKEFFAFEAEAVVLWSYQTMLIPGLLQTEEYARALLSGGRPLLDEKAVEERVATRLDRQQLLTRARPVDFSFVIHEAALRTPMGGREAHKRQLMRLLEVSHLRHVCLQVLPFDRVVPDALNGPMVLLETQHGHRYFLTEGQELSHFSSEEVGTLSQRYGAIRAQALPSEESRSFLERMVDEL